MVPPATQLLHPEALTLSPLDLYPGSISWSLSMLIPSSPSLSALTLSDLFPPSTLVKEA